MTVTITAKRVKIMEYVTLNNGIKMPKLGYAYIRYQMKNVNDAY